MKYLILTIVLLSSITNMVIAANSCQLIGINACFVILNCSSSYLSVDSSQLNNYTKRFFTDLILTYNNFDRYLPVAQLNTFDDMRLIDLSYNNLDETTNDLKLIDCNILYYLKRWLLAANKFRTLPSLSPSCMKIIEVLIMNNNKALTNIDYDVTSNKQSYTQMPALKYLDLSYNSIEYINQFNSTILYYMPNLQGLNLYNNNIKVIYQTPFVNTPSLKYLSFDSPSMYCDVKLLWLKYYLNQSTIMSINNTEIAATGSNQSYNFVNGSFINRPYQPYCYNELTMQNSSLTTLDDGLFYSAINLTTTVQNPMNIYALYGTTVELNCQLFSIPESDIWWNFNNRDLEHSADGMNYEFIDTKVNSSVKYSILRIKNVTQNLAGTYTCKAFYAIVDPPPPNLIHSLKFQLNVSQPVTANKLSAGEIVGIVFGCIIGLLLLLLILGLLLYFCCYKRRICCFNRTSKSKKQSMYLYNGKSSNGNGFNGKLNVNSNSQIAIEEKAAGFHDNSYTKPNYIINTISKGTSNQYLIDDQHMSSQYQINNNNNNTNFNNINSSSSKYDSSVYNVNNPAFFNSNKYLNDDYTFATTNNNNNNNLITDFDYEYRPSLPSQYNQSTTVQSLIPRTIVNNVNDADLYYSQFKHQQQSGGGGGAGGGTYLVDVVDDPTLRYSTNNNINNSNNMSQHAYTITTSTLPFEQQYIQTTIDTNNPNNLNSFFNKYDSDV